MIFSCLHGRRTKAAVIGNPTDKRDWTISEVIDHRPSSLFAATDTLVTCLKTAPTGLTASNVLIVGGLRVLGKSTAEWICACRSTPPEATAQEALYFAVAAEPKTMSWWCDQRMGNFSPLHVPSGE